MEQAAQKIQCMPIIEDFRSEVDGVRWFRWIKPLFIIIDKADRICEKMLRTFLTFPNPGLVLTVAGKLYKGRLEEG